MKRTLTILTIFISLHATAQNSPQIDWDKLNETEPWKITETWQDVPVVTSGEANRPPSDAIVLFDGEDLSAWQKPPFSFGGAGMEQVAPAVKSINKLESGRSADWVVKDGELIVAPEKGAIATRQSFGDVQLHIEWMSPVDEGKTGQGYSNSGIFLMGLYEVQVLNSYENATYANGQAGSVYKQHIPLVNASRPPGTWQEYDIMFTAPRFSEKGRVMQPARVTVLHNGVLVLYDAVLQGPTIFIGEPYYVPHPDKLPLILQDHGDKVRYRNIWIREL